MLCGWNKGNKMRTAPGGRGLPFLPLNLQPGHASARGSIASIASAVDAAPFPELHGAPPIVQPKPGEGLECIGTEDDQYSTNWYDACWRVLISNPPRGDAQRVARIRKRRSLSFLGQKGHIERASAWTHLVGAFGFLLFALVRPVTDLDSTSASGRLSTYTCAVLAITFAVSTGYHTLGTTRWLAPIARLFDHGAIDVALAVACTTDASVVTLDFHDVPWQAAVDSSGVALVILCFFVYRRLVLPAEDTEISWGSCRLGLFRVSHADYEYSALRSSSYIVLAFGFISIVPTAVRNLTATASSTLIVCNGVSLMLLMAGMFLDNVVMFPDVMYEDGFKRGLQKPAWTCHNTGCGCIMTSHALWHVFSLVSVLTLTVGREVAIAETAFHTHPH
jgi:predicted membrane channel-forming protein YqfA (hemolysin III family)